jgi:RNA polymerase sigma-70 factor (ECF subfamily)
LLEAARDGDANAFCILVRRYETTMARVAVRILGEGPDAQDVAQEAMVRLYESLADFRGESCLGTYLTRITINLSLSVVRSKIVRLRRSSEARWCGRPFQELLEQGPDHRAESEQIRNGIARALLTLSPNDRAVVATRILHGASTKETAAKLGVPEGTVMSRLSRALRRLRPLLIAQNLGSVIEV